ncbi:hypothetical protein F2Z20_09855 [Bacteroides finegoldii]|uniref:Uncharacterized protein n=1 Tax=Bacteroides finegoldii TaxID=338188 RepID=A0A7J4YPH2_9BACE|nr:hypothetical protein F2Z28_10965 [Bacteroides finegoldii]KAA5221102.1 hypothetical protein F2Z16_10120 [Bacteroides finegoldii]KAA5225844.1 hypothetical protein F2Z20_09855 [Bacteroides finegoldii]KAA5230349.1 hypothetical protein F2Z22_09970 [Bacteroides finegoldii]KAA5232626.1 hypothetical protein F2Z21_10230 [Bacteroides finegoldii]
MTHILIFCLIIDRKGNNFTAKQDLSRTFFHSYNRFVYPTGLFIHSVNSNDFPVRIILQFANLHAAQPSFPS